MDKEKPRLARLAAILTQLQSKSLVTAKQIADKHQVSIRTVYRDIRTLELSGIPIVTEEGKGYSIMEGYSLPPIMFTQEEANALITAEQIVERNNDQSFIKQYKNAIQKIKAVLKLGQKDKSELLSERIQIRTKIENDNSSTALMHLQSAITNYKVQDLKYQSLSKQLSQRKIEPFALINTQDNWILIAYCQLREDFRVFRLDCIQKINDSGLLFEPHKMTLQEYFDKKRKEWEATPDTPLT